MFLRQLTYLVALDQYRHFSRAAEHCGVSQPALSAAIRQLENELGLTIIQRNRRFQGFTPAGERVLAWAHETLADLGNLRQEASFAQDIAGGSISLCAIPPTVLVLPLLLESFRAVLPALHVNATICPNADALHHLQEHRSQLALMYLDQVPSGGLFDTHPLYDEQQVLAAAPSVALPGTRHIGWEDLSDLPLGLLNNDMRCRQFVNAAFQSAGITPTITLETNSVTLLHAELLNGRIATILPIAALPLQATPDGPLQIRKLAPTNGSTIGLVRLARPMQTALTTRMWEIGCRLSLDDVFTL
ncbi:LysR family transcriptional regulator [Acetobacter estunensis]|uniref:LysR family transcriptional regulator n=1 Tax=Acetobacter estunensis TaxID=104097 RepID=UPI001C2D37CB|nr:LysR family transcriptional regulator [Acetobacter estunensis]MBV1836315.1 LysR family transcriptional regulator [Acetobacter estunensis]